MLKGLALQNLKEAHTYLNLATENKFDINNKKINAIYYLILLIYS